MINSSFIADLIQHKENLQIEFVGEYMPSLALKAACAFLNTEGGWVLLGYNGKELLGISEGIEEKVAEIKSFIVENIYPNL